MSVQGETPRKGPSVEAGGCSAVQFVPRWLQSITHLILMLLLGGRKLYVSRVFVFEEYSIGFPISASIPNTTLMSAHLLIAVAYLCRFN